MSFISGLLKNHMRDANALVIDFNNEEIITDRGVKSGRSEAGHMAETFPTNFTGKEVTGAKSISVVLYSGGDLPNAGLEHVLSMTKVNQGVEKLAVVNEDVSTEMSTLGKVLESLPYSNVTSLDLRGFSTDLERDEIVDLRGVMQGLDLDRKVEITVAEGSQLAELKQAARPNPNISIKEAPGISLPNSLLETTAEGKEQYKTEKTGFISELTDGAINLAAGRSQAAG